MSLTEAQHKVAEAPAPVVRYGIALGSNQGDRLAHLKAGVAGLLKRVDVRLVNRAPIYETAPIDCPVGSDPFYNSVIEVESTLLPLELHRHLQHLEASEGRLMKREPNAPRPLDLDLLYAGEMLINNPVLTVPHPRLKLRRFVLQPLADIQPHLILPGEVRTVAQLLTDLSDDPAAVRLVAAAW